MKIKKATLKDAKRISNLIKRNILNAKINKYTPEQKKGLIEKNSLSIIKDKIKNFEMFCAFKKEKLIGTIYLGEKYKRKFKIGGLYIEPKFLNQRIGTKLLKFAEEYAKKKDIKKIHLYSLRFSKEFYLKQGYKINKSYIWRIGKTKTITHGMEKKLK